MGRQDGGGGKRKGGGPAVFVKDTLCNSGHSTAKDEHCSKDLELLAVHIKPYFLP